MKRIILIINVIAAISISQAQNNNNQKKNNITEFIKVKLNERYGLFDNTGKEILQPIYDGISITDDDEIGLYI
jgi:hypothetical protein